MGRYSDLFSKANDAFKGNYKNELNKLKGLSKKEINSVIPNTENSTIYAALIKVVEEASEANLSKAKLAENIKELGDLAVKLAKKIPGLDSIL